MLCTGRVFLVELDRVTTRTRSNRREINTTLRTCLRWSFDTVAAAMFIGLVRLVDVEEELSSEGSGGMW